MSFANPIGGHVRILKYQLQPGAGLIRMPYGAELLHVHTQHGEPCLWVEAPVDADDHDRRIAVVPTGTPFEKPGDYLGTVHVHEGALVFHVYDAGWA